MTLQQITLRVVELKNHSKQLKADYDAAIAANERELQAILESKQIIIGGLDLAKVESAKLVVYCHGWNSRGSEGASAVSDAIVDIANGAPRLKSEYFGAKNYDRWSGQRSDHGYGYGPKHGSIVMEVGLTDEVRERLREGGNLTTDEIEAALYFLNCIPQIEEAKSRAERESA